jgi:hypothetical protein
MIQYKKRCELCKSYFLCSGNRSNTSYCDSCRERIYKKVKQSEMV